VNCYVNETVTNETVTNDHQHLGCRFMQTKLWVFILPSYV